MADGTRKEETLSRVEKQLVLLAIDRKRNADANVARMIQEAQQLSQQAADQFTLDTRPIQEAHNIGENVSVLFDVRDDDDKTMFLAWTAPKEPEDPAVIGAIAPDAAAAPAAPIDPLT